jgi:hypothetical protein
MHYLGSYRFLFTSRNWATNLMLGMLCLFIPAIGGIVLMGYLFEVIEFLHRRRPRPSAQPPEQPPSDAFGELVMDALPANPDFVIDAYPDFTFDRFSEYLSRGIWPFLVRMIVGFAVGAAVSVLMMLAMALVGAASAHSAALAVAVGVIFFLLYLALMAVLGIVVTPLYLRAGLSSDFGSAFSMEFFRDFLKRVGKELVLAELFLVGTGTLLTIVGFLACYVGIFPAMTLMMFAYHHLDYQLYELYLERGGTSIERKQTPSPALPEEEEEFRSTDVMRRDREAW